MDIREFTYVLAIVDSGRFTSAAEKLHMSQPSLSIYIKNLENRLTFPLFERNNRKLILTPEGKTYVEYARQIVQLNNEMHQKFASLEHLESGIVHIGITNNKSTLLLPKLIPVLNSILPNFEIVFIEDTSAKLENRVIQRELDFILVNYPFRTYDYDWSFIKLFKEEFLLALPVNSPYSAKAIQVEGSEKPWLDITLLKHEKFILAKPGFKLRQVADYLFMSKSIHPDVLMETDNIATACGLTQSGIGASFTMDTYVNSLPTGRNSLCLFSVGDPCITTDYVIAFPKGCHLSKAANTLINSLKEHLPLIKQKLSPG